MTTLDHDGLLAQKRAHPEWVWNRSDTHVILGVPESPEAFKTIVEPGNSFSPGFRSYGVSTWISVNGEFYAPEEMASTALHWRYARGYLPVLDCTWAAGPLTVTSSLFTDGDPASRDVRTHLTLVVTNDSAEPVEATAHVVIRSFGAAGGPILELEFDGRDVLVNGSVAMTFSAVPHRTGALSFDGPGEDISVLLRDGRFPAARHVVDSSSWASGTADFEFSFPPGGSGTVSATAFVHAGHPHLTWLHRTRALAFDPPDRATFEAAWMRRLPIQLDLPDARFAEAFQAQLAYLAMSTVGVEPRISPISYPLWWLRDGSYALTALGKGGYSEWVDRAIRSVAGRAPFGGFGAEGDGASELIWLISEHYLMTRDLDFLRAHYPDVQRNAELIRSMRTATGPLFGRTEIRTPQMMFSPEADLMCAAAEDGLITGRMDNHFPRFWVNGWAYFALKRAAMCAEAVGADPEPHLREAAEQLAALGRMKGEHFGEDDRDVTSCLWPTGWAQADDPVIIRGFQTFWDTVRSPGGLHVPEPEWTYFEAGQAHNYVLLGQREQAWVSIEMFLARHAAQGLYTYHEGIGDENSSLQWQRSRGWDDIPHVTPHGWTAAELFLLLRDCLVRETPAGELVVGSGVPIEWMSSSFSVRGLPSHFGAIDIHYDATSQQVSVLTDREPSAVRSELPSPVNLTVSQRSSPARSLTAAL